MSVFVVDTLKNLPHI